MWAAPEAFPQALFELLDNAVRATRRGHPVVMDVRDTAEGDVLWQLQDMGGGISPSIVDSLGRAGEVDRAGHGLALAWAIVDDHGGQLGFESAAGVGTTASVWLPGREGTRTSRAELTTTPMRTLR